MLRKRIVSFGRIIYLVSILSDSVLLLDFLRDPDNPLQMNTQMRTTIKHTIDPMNALTLADSTDWIHVF